MKKTNIEFRIADDVKRDFAIAAKLRGLTMSALLHSLVVRTIREEKEASPQSFIQTSMRTPYIKQLPQTKTKERKAR